MTNLADWWIAPTERVTTTMADGVAASMSCFETSNRRHRHVVTRRLSRAVMAHRATPPR